MPLFSTTNAGRMIILVALVAAQGIASSATPVMPDSARPGRQLRLHIRSLLQRKYQLSPDPDNKNCYMYRASSGDSIPEIAGALGVAEDELKQRNSANIQDLSRLNGRFVQICNIKNYDRAEGPGGGPLKPGGRLAAAPAPAPKAEAPKAEAPAPAPKAEAPAPGPAPKSAAPAAAPAPAPKSAAPAAQAAAPTPVQTSGPSVGIPILGGGRPGITPFGGLGGFVGRRRK